ncbi:exodeoxyribonuclease V subunit gamma [Buchnera aphidicola (Mollitrichosiphum nigrofasciatum)]|uniref:exodeoxyribonuclease V subunit gamma n=1 Tax=Buchnera aphidicola TaxID=9 RepID=UPI0031B80743
MFFLYQANTLNLLISKISEIFKKKKLPNPMVKEIFITNNKYITQWIKILIAKKYSIHANIKYINIKKFIYKMACKINKKKISFFKKEKTIWKIFEIINDNKEKNYTKYFYIAEEILNIFNKYIIYRKNWIHNWEKKKKTKQKLYQKIWNKLIQSDIKKKKYHFSKILYFFKKNIKINKIKIPKRIFIFNLLSINPLYLSILYQISKILKIYLFLPGPNFIYKNKINNLYKYYDIKNKLLRSCGKLGYEYIHNFTKKKIKIINLYKKCKRKKILNIIQNKLISKNPYFALQNTKKNIKKDNSIKIFSCNEKHQEIEILHINLLKLINTNKLSPKNILILSTKIDKYIPYIHTIFNYSNNVNKIPYIILKKKNKKTKNLLHIINFIFDIDKKVINNKNIINFLKLKYISKKFGINKKDIKKINIWIEDSGIISSLDNKNLNKQSLPKIFQNTWLFGINRILLGISINKKYGIWNNILPCDTYINKTNDLLGKLIFFLKKIKKWQKIIKKKHKFKKIREILKKLIKDFLPKKMYFTKIIKKIKKKWQKITEKNKINKKIKKIKIEVLKKTFLKSISSFVYINNIPYFIKGSVIFCNIEYMPNIEFKMIYIIGLNNTIFPKKQKFHYKDLTQFYTKKNDINKFNQDCYLFLELILSAKKYFYISYIGYNYENYKKIPPSIVVTELKNFILNNFNIIHENKKKIIKNKCSNIIFNNYIHTPIKIKKKIKLYKIKKKKIKKKKKKINLDNLLKFWKNPINYFFQHSLNINFKINNKNLKYNDTIKNEYILKKKILKNIIKRNKMQKLFKKYELSGIIPYGNIGKIIWNKNIKEILPLIKNIYNNYHENKIIKIKIFLDNIKLYGKLKNIHKNKIFLWTMKTINIKNTIKLWIQHLIYCIYNINGESIILGRNNSKWGFKNLKKKKAIKYLKLYIKGYLQGQNKPLLITNSGINNLYNKYCKNIKKKNKKFHETWEGNSFKKGEKKNPYIAKLIPEKNNIIVNKLCKIAKFWYSPIIKYRK